MDEIGAISLDQFDAAQQLLADIDGPAAASLIAAAADVALVIDGQGVIRDVSIGQGGIGLEGSAHWVGRHWLETVTSESRPKVLAMLRDAMSTSPSATRTERAWRQVNHPVAQGGDVPVLYAVVPVGNQGRLLAVGRDLRAVSTLQQRLVDAQQSMERDYQRLRQTEARYRLLFDSVSEAALMVDAATLAVVEANPSAMRLFGDAARKLVGRPLLDALEIASRPQVAALFTTIRAGGRADDVLVRLAGGAGDEAGVTLSATAFRQDAATLVLVRLLPAPTSATPSERVRDDVSLMRVLDRAPDAFVVTDPQGRILSANASFAELVQLPAGEQATGQSLDRWLGRSSVDLNVLLGTLKQHGVVRLFPTTLRAPYGLVLKVEISAVAVLQDDPPCLGFAIRDVERRLANDNRAAREIPRSPSQLAELVGRMPMRDIVSETTDLIERMCIEAALELTHDNRASAAEMLGISRQSLYVKLRRYGLGDLGSGDPA
jgi:transcriptional regulator PpsR